MEKRQIPVTKNYLKLKEADKAGNFYKVLEGSSGSGKTYSIVQYLIEKAQAKKRIITGARFDQATCRDSIIEDFKMLMMDYFKLWDPKRWNASNFDYIFPNGSAFQFRGASSPAKLHGPRRSIYWGNEAMEFPYDSHRQVAMRTSDEIIYDFNPSLNHHWIFDKILTRDDCAYIHSTFRDNTMLPANAVSEIEALEPTPENKRQGTADEWAWTVYGLGKRGRKEGCIFKIWDVTDDWPDRWLCQRWGYGLDYGFSQDPTALVECALFQDTLYLREHLYEKELVAQANPLDPSIKSIEGKLKELGIPEDARIHAENARPEINRALQLSNFKVVPTIKTPDTILAGIDRMRSVPIKVHRSSHNLQMEMESYSWAKNAQGVYLDKPEDKNNHLIDGARYWALAELSPLRKPRLTGKRRKTTAQTSMRTWR